jgi:transcriptional regulator with XRE-family HTH domain
LQVLHRELWFLRFTGAVEAAMIELSEILDRARAKIGATSDRQLAQALGVVPSSFTQYRHGISLPSDDVMVRICLASGIAEEAGLLLLNMWRSQGRSRTIYRRLFKVWEVIEARDYSKKVWRTLPEQIDAQ